jgi:hypothetical protein
MQIPVVPSLRGRVRAWLASPVGPAMFGAALVIALGFAIGGPDAGVAAAPTTHRPARPRIARPPALGRFAVAPLLLRRLDGTVDGGRTVHGPGGAVSDTSSVVLGPWLFQDVMGRPRREAPWGIILRDDAGPVVLASGVTMPPALDGLRFASVIGGVDYSDPLGINLPLVWVQGFEDHALTARFRVRDFATRDGAPFARISPDLVGGLERLSQRLGTVHVISGYRHPAYNRLRRVGGALFSRHQAGQAADIYAPGRTPFEVARAAIETMGCGIGIGLGPTSVHVDVRGSLMTWTYRGAALSEAAFDLWAHTVCRGSLPASALYAAEVRWLAGGDDREEMSALLGFEPPAPEAPAADSAAAADPAGIVYNHAEALRSFALASMATHGPGVVAVDFRAPGALRAGPAGRMRFVRGASPEATFLGTRALLEWVAHPDRAGRYLVYAFKLPGRTAVGVLPLEGALAAPPPSAAPAAPVQTAPPPAAPASPQWVIVLASSLDRAVADQQLARWRTELAAADVRVALQIDGSAGGARYRVAAGPYPTPADAGRAREALGDLLPAEAWVLRVGG